MGEVALKGEQIAHAVHVSSGGYYVQVTRKHTQSSRPRLVIDQHRMQRGEEGSKRAPSGTVCHIWYKVGINRHRSSRLVVLQGVTEAVFGKERVDLVCPPVKLLAAPRLFGYSCAREWVSVHAAWQQCGKDMCRGGGKNACAAGVCWQEPLGTKPLAAPQFW